MLSHATPPQSGGNCFYCYCAQREISPTSVPLLPKRLCNLFSCRAMAKVLSPFSLACKIKLILQALSIFYASRSAPSLSSVGRAREKA